jgi:beta-galactosidase
MPKLPRLASILLTLAHLTLLAAPLRAADWRPVPDRMLTDYGEQVTVDNAWQEYPRPHMQRAAWQNLNGLWDYAVTPHDAAAPPTDWSGKILVPYCLESTLGGVGRLLEPNEALWYRRQFEVTGAAPGKEVLLNFEAVDYQATVYVNGQEVGRHTGGNTPFTLRITDALKPGANELTLRVLDATQDYQLRGKQKLEPEGIWYTRVSGIWQTVWLETVPKRHLAELDVTTKINPATITVTPRVENAAPGDKVQVEVLLDGEPAPLAAAPAGSPVALTIPALKLWSPDAPTLYDLKVTLLAADGQPVDSVHSYAGIREIGRRQDADGHWRLTLNGKFLFHFGPLDQGWWPDGLLTPPSDAALVDEIAFLKSAGFNMIRKHIKVEPRRYYYHCDRLGMLLWQDQPSTMGGPKWTRLEPNPVDAQFPDAAHQQFMAELEEMVDLLEVHPSIVVWVPFNEAWGQHRTVEVGQWLVRRDGSRLVNVASGGNFWPAGHIADQHAYPSPAFPLDDARFADYVKVVGEFGGHGWPVKGHLWNESERNWGYGGLPKTREEYEQRYERTIAELVALKQQGVAAGVYTQTSDVEGEINGLVTYDRREQKLSAERLKKLHAPLYEEAGD